MEAMLPFFLVFFAGVIFSALFGRLHVPLVTALLFGGMLIGPFGLDVVPLNDSIRVIGEIGVVFLTFMAGLETRLSSMARYRKTIAQHAALHGVLPLLAGVGIGAMLGLTGFEAALLGIIFMSTSIAVMVPSLDAKGLLHTKLGKVILGSTVVVDIVSLILLSLLLQAVSPIARVPLPAFYFLLFVLIVGLRYVLPWIERLLSSGKVTRDDIFEQEIRAAMAVLFLTVIIFETLGLHAVIGGFFAGLVLSDTIRSHMTIEKLKAIAYGVFIPVFFVTAGMQIDAFALFKASDAWVMVVAVVLGSIGAKFASGWAAGRLDGFTNHESMVMGASAVPRLSTTLAIVYTGGAYGIINPALSTALVIMSLVTTLLGPLVVRSITLSPASLNRHS
jgi:Kef-type K+ transport system membrane component KefB